ncbi:unnamed protein product [Protopolystoma xenopodis]|uniref:Uncharacterized protein n=1 Tax=Protopolystoma xenopodis TaxID=117903 RepID=A0A448XKH6_9PLAT|nr:unnamed protein product [Protopolystoma xenopodis]
MQSIQLSRRLVLLTDEYFIEAESEHGFEWIMREYFYGVYCFVLSSFGEMIQALRACLPGPDEEGSPQRTALEI